MERVAALFTQRPEHPYQPDRGLIICRTPEPFALTPRLRVISGFTIRDTWTE